MKRVITNNSWNYLHIHVCPNYNTNHISKTSNNITLFYLLYRHIIIFKLKQLQISYIAGVWYHWRDYGWNVIYWIHVIYGIDDKGKGDVTGRTQRYAGHEGTDPEASERRSRRDGINDTSMCDSVTHTCSRGTRVHVYHRHTHTHMCNISGHDTLWSAS